MAKDAANFELQSRKDKWDKNIETVDGDSWNKFVTIHVDSSTPSQYGSDARVSNADSDLEAGKQAMAEEKELARSRQGAIVPSIPKVREQFRGGDRESYTPHYVPIGPYHLDRSSPRIEKEKLCSVGFLHSLSEKHAKGGLSGVADKLEPLVRLCYPDRVGHMTPEKLSRMLLRDGCYLLACMVDYHRTSSCCNNGEKQKQQQQEAAHSSRHDHGMAQIEVDVQAEGGLSDDSTVVRDTVFLVENQIPLFVLQKIHERVTGDTSSSVLEDLAIHVQQLLQQELYISKKLRPAPQQQAASHLLHLAHGYIRPTMFVRPAAAMEDDSKPRRRLITGRWRRATEYRSDADVRFKRRDLVEGVESSILDVSLAGGTLWIPRLRVHGDTWATLRNLMALEEQFPRRPVTAYCVFMSQLACATEDVKLMVREGIVEHFLSGDEQVARGFADLCKGVVMDVDNLDRNYLKPVWHQLQERCDNRVHRWFYRCRRRHAEIAILLLVALVVFACQVIQTFYAVTGGPKH